MTEIEQLREEIARLALRVIQLESNVLNFRHVGKIPPRTFQEAQPIEPLHWGSWGLQPFGSGFHGGRSPLLGRW